MGGVSASVLMTLRVVLVLKYGYSGASSLGDIKRCTVATEHFNRRPFGKDREGWRRMRAEFLCCMDDFSTDDGEDRLDVFDVLAVNGEVVICKHGEVSKLAWSKGAFFASFIREPTASLRVKAQGLLAAEAIAVQVHRDAADCLSSDEPIEGNPRVITGDTCGVSARAN